MTLHCRTHNTIISHHITPDLSSDAAAVASAAAAAAAAAVTYYRIGRANPAVSRALAKLAKVVKTAHVLYHLVYGT